MNQDPNIVGYSPPPEAVLSGFQAESLVGWLLSEAAGAFSGSAPETMRAEYRIDSLEQDTVQSMYGAGCALCIPDGQTGRLIEVAIIE